MKYQKLSELKDISKFENHEDYYLVELSGRSRIFNSKELDAILEREENFQINYEDSYLYLVNKDYIKEFSRYGSYMAGNLHELDGTKIFEREKIVGNLKNDLNNPQYELVQFIPNKHNKKIWRDLKGTVHCEPFLLDWIEAELEDSTYLLDEFVESLSQRDDVAFMTHTSRWSQKKPGLLYAPVKGDEPNVGGVIEDIEHHLEYSDPTPDEKEGVHLVYYPKVEDLEKILAWDSDVELRKPETRKREIYNVKMFIVRDILGGEKYRIMPPEPEEQPKRKFKH